MPRKALPNRRGHVTQRVRIGGKRTLYLSVDNERAPNEVFLRIRGQASSEKVCLYDVIARLVSLAMQEGVPVASIAERLLSIRSLPAGPVEGDQQIKMCDSTLDFVGRWLLVNCCGRKDLAHVHSEETA